MIVLGIFSTLFLVQGQELAIWPHLLPSSFYLTGIHWKCHSDQWKEEVLGQGSVHIPTLPYWSEDMLEVLC